VIAMAQYRLRRGDEALNSLRQAAEIVHTKVPTLENGALEESWADGLIAQLLLHEAESLLDARGDRTSAGINRAQSDLHW